MPSIDSEKHAVGHTDVTKVDSSASVPPVASITPEEDKRVLRKIDWRLLPLMCTIYGLQFLDKTSLTYASVMGFQYDLKIGVNEYAWVASIFHFGYLAGEYPMCLALHKFPIAKVTSLMIIIWGFILCMMTVGKNYTHMLVIRFLLGFFESGIAPSLVLITAQYYRKGEQGTRVGIWASFNTLGGIFGGAVAYGLAQADVKRTLSMKGWRVLFILLGLMTVVVGILFWFFIPDSPEQASFLQSDDDKRIHKARMAENQVVMAEKKWEWDQVWECLRDPVVYLYCLCALCTNIPNGAISNFFGILVVSMGFTPHQALLLAIANAWLAFLIIFALWAGDRFKNRCLISIPCAMVSVLGAALVWGLPFKQKYGRLVGNYLSLAFAVPLIVGMSLITTNVGGRTKKTTVNALFFIFLCVGNIIGPQTYKTKDAPRFAPALLTVVIMDIITVVIMAGIYLIYRYRNAKRDKAMGGEKMDTSVQLQDISDLKNPHFRYAL